METKCELAGLLYEAQICLTAVCDGLSGIRKTVTAGELAGETLAERLGVLNKMLAQSGEALDALDEELEKLLKRKAEPARASLTEDDEAAIFATLEFYGDEETHERQAGKPSLITRDRGQRARKVLDALDGRGDNAPSTDRQ